MVFCKCGPGLLETSGVLGLLILSLFFNGLIVFQNDLRVRFYSLTLLSFKHLIQFFFQFFNCLCIQMFFQISIGIGFNP